ncbi:MAG: DbpA RNA binding domain-containing protein, partial [Myxococcota bacterium]|nr:DbpA RNA binding domain-containing protein [Myxococcota bacterium]
GIAISFASHGERRRVHNYERALKVQIKPMHPPTDRDVAIRKRTDLKQRMSETLSGDLGDVHTWLEELRQEGWSDADLAAASMALLSKSERLRLGPLPTQREAAPLPEHHAPQPRESRRDTRDGHRGQQQGRPNFDEVNEVQLMLFTGSQFRVRPGDLVGALANELDIPGHRIGRVAIHERKSFVGLPRAIAEKALAERTDLPVRGRPVRIAMARPQTEGPSRGASRSGDRPFKAKAHGGAPRGGDRPFKGKGKTHNGPPRRPPRGGDRPFKGKPKAKGAGKSKHRGQSRGRQAAA